MGITLQTNQKPFKFPLNYSELLRYLLPQKRPAEREAFFREYVRLTLERKRILRIGGVDIERELTMPAPTEQDVDAALDTWRSNQHTESAVRIFHPWFISFLIEHTAAIRKKRAQTAAAGRWKRKKSATVRKHKATARKHK